MPAVVTHYCFARRVITRLQGQIEAVDMPAVDIGAQGPDIFYFHRALPWLPGKGYAKLGLALHNLHPAVLFEGLGRAIMSVSEQDAPVARGFMAGFICHYVLDRNVHPFVLHFQKQLAKEQPHYDFRENWYHYRVESALDTLTLLREMGRTNTRFPLTNALPKPDRYRDVQIARWYGQVFRLLPGAPGIDPVYAAKAVADTRHALFWMSDRWELKQTLVLRPLEKLFREGHLGSALLRQNDVSDFDYANCRRASWEYRGQRVNSTFYELYDQSVAEAAELIKSFLETVRQGAPDGRIFGNLDFAGKAVE